MPKQEINLSTSHWTIGVGIEKDRVGALFVIDIDSTYRVILSRKDIAILAAALLRASLDQEIAQVETPKDPRNLGDLPEYAAWKETLALATKDRFEYTYAWSRNMDADGLSVLLGQLHRSELAEHKALHALLDAASDL